MDTVKEAGSALGGILRVLVELAIWFGIVVIPLLAPPVLVSWAVARWIKRRSRQSRP